MLRGRFSERRWKFCTITMQLLLYSVEIVLSFIRGYHVERILFISFLEFKRVRRPCSPITLSPSPSYYRYIKYRFLFWMLIMSGDKPTNLCFTIRVFQNFSQSFGVGEKLLFVETNVTVLLVFGLIGHFFDQDVIRNFQNRSRVNELGANMYFFLWFRNQL